MGRNYYPQVYSKECKYKLKAKKIITYITDDIKIPSDKDDYFMEKDSNEKA